MRRRTGSRRVWHRAKIVATDSGHDNVADNLASAGGSAAFGTDPQPRIDFGYRAIGLVASLARILVTLHYGAAPVRSYFDGCSNGGREAVMVSQRFPDFLDGVLSGDPGFDLPKAAVAEAWNVQTRARAATGIDVNGIPYLPSALSAPPPSASSPPRRRARRGPATRPLCAYPSYARYDGHGPIDDAASIPQCLPAVRRRTAPGDGLYPWRRVRERRRPRL